MRPELELSRSDHATMIECNLEFADGVSESDPDYLPSTSPLPTDTDTPLPVLSCQKSVWPEKDLAPKTDGIFERNVQATKQALSYTRNKVHSINSVAGVRLTLDPLHNGVENNNNNDFKLTLKHPPVQNCALIVRPFLQHDALCDSSVVNNGHDNGISLRQQASNVTSVRSKLMLVQSEGFVSETSRRPGLTHQNAAQCELEAELIMSSRPGENNQQTSDESLYLSRSFTSATSSSVTASTSAATSSAAHFPSAASTFTTHQSSTTNNTTDGINNTAGLINTGVQSVRSLSCDSESVTLGDGVSTDTDEARRRISFTLSFCSDVSSSGTDVKTKPTWEDGVQVDKGGGMKVSDLSLQNMTTNFPMMTSTHGEKQDTRKSGRSRRQQDAKDGRGTLTMRISKSLSNFLKKTPSKSMTLTDMVDPAEKDASQAAAHKNGHRDKPSRQEPKRQVSLAGRVMTSLAKLGRKARSNFPDDDDEFNNRNTPVFVAPGDQVDVVDKEPGPLSQVQCMLLKESWVVIKSDVTEVGVETFMGLFNTHPDAIDSFLAFKDKTVQDLERSAVLKAHALRVMQTVDKCITRLDQADKMAALLLQLGRRHVGYQANIKLIPIIGKQFVSAIEPKMASAWSREMKSAWVALFAIINYNMRLGIMEEKNKQIKAEAEASRKKLEDRKKRDKTH